MRASKIWLSIGIVCVAVAGAYILYAAGKDREAADNREFERIIDTRSVKIGQVYRGLTVTGIRAAGAKIGATNLPAPKGANNMIVEMSGTTKIKGTIRKAPEDITSAGTYWIAVDALTAAQLPNLDSLTGLTAGGGVFEIRLDPEDAKKYLPQCEDTLCEFTISHYTLTSTGAQSSGASALLIDATPL